MGCLERNPPIGGINMAGSRDNRKTLGETQPHYRVFEGYHRIIRNVQAHAGRCIVDVILDA